jgi:hypothetical protein
MNQHDSTYSYSISETDFTNSENIWRRAFKEIQPLLSALAGENGNQTLAIAYQEALSATKHRPSQWGQTGWRNTLAEALSKEINLTKTESIDWPLLLARPEKCATLLPIAWACQVNPQETLQLLWIKNSCLIALTDDLKFLHPAIQNHIRLIIRPNKTSTRTIYLKAWIWHKNNFLLPAPVSVP